MKHLRSLFLVETKQQLEELAKLYIELGKLMVLLFVLEIVTSFAFY